MKSPTPVRKWIELMVDEVRADPMRLLVMEQYVWKLVGKCNPYNINHKSETRTAKVSGKTWYGIGGLKWRW